MQASRKGGPITCGPRNGPGSAPLKRRCSCCKLDMNTIARFKELIVRLILAVLKATPLQLDPGGKT